MLNRCSDPGAVMHDIQQLQGHFSKQAKNFDPTTNLRHMPIYLCRVNPDQDPYNGMMNDITRGYDVRYPETTAMSICKTLFCFELYPYLIS